MPLQQTLTWGLMSRPVTNSTLGFDALAVTPLNLGIGAPSTNFNLWFKDAATNFNLGFDTPATNCNMGLTPLSQTLTCCLTLMGRKLYPGVWCGLTQTLSYGLTPQLTLLNWGLMPKTLTWSFMLIPQTLKTLFNIVEVRLKKLQNFKVWVI